jgi:hypothetical protein
VDTGAAAEMLNVSKRSVETERKVQASAAPELVGAVERGDIWYRWYRWNRYFFISCMGRAA